MKDLVLDNDDLLFEAGDFKLSDTTLQHQKLIIHTTKGDWKYTPETGVGIEKYFLNENFAGLIKEIRKQLVIDGMSVEDISITNIGELQIKAEYENIRG